MTVKEKKSWGQNISWQWEPEMEGFWEDQGKKIAYRNLMISILSLLLAFSVWQLWSVLALNLPKVGFAYTTDQMFTLTAIPSLTGAILRVYYSFAAVRFGGKTWTIISTAILFIPCIGIGLVVQNPDTPFWMMAALAALCGFGSANFSSSMTAIAPFFPKKVQGTALGLNGGLGNLGVSAAQFLIPLVITAPLFGALGGQPQTWIDQNGTSHSLWLQNGAFLWILPLAITLLLAAWGMNNLPLEGFSFREQLSVFKGKHMYLITILYVMSFGSFIGFSAAFPLLLGSQFPVVNPLQYAFLGPLLGALLRPVGGVLADKLGGGARVSFCSVIMMTMGTYGVIYYISPGTQGFGGFFLMFILLFAMGGIANGAIFRMIPCIFGPKESPAAIGYSSAIGAFGGFFIPKAFGSSIAATGSAIGALWVFIFYYILCAWILWYYYARKQAEIKC